MGKEGTCYDKRWVLGGRDQPLISPPETNIALYVT